MTLLLWLATACDPATDTVPFDSGDTDSGDTDSGDTDSGDTDSGVCGEEPTCALEVVGSDAECGSGSSGEPTYVMAAEMKPGEIQVTVVNAVLGCCPESADVAAQVTPAANTIDLTWTLGPDPCECACMLDVSGTVLAVPAGTWTVRAEGHQATVVSSGP